MKSRTLITALLIACVPFIVAGNCSGQLYEGDPALQIQQPGADAYFDTGMGMAQTGDVAKGDGDKTENVICQEPVVPEENQGPPCLRYLPDGFDAYIAVNVDSVLANMQAIQSIGAFDKFMDQIGDAITALDPNMKPKDFAANIDSVCFACLLEPPASSAVPFSSSSSFFQGCKEMVVADAFKNINVVQLPDLMANAGIDQIDDMGRYIIKNNAREFLAMQPADDNVIVMGTSKIINEVQGSNASYMGNISPALSNTIRIAWPSTIVVLANEKAVPLLMNKTVMDYFAPVMMYVSQAMLSQQQVSMLGAMNMADTVKLSVSIHDIEKAKAADNVNKALILRSFYEMPSMEFLYSYQSAKKAMEMKAFDSVAMEHYDPTGAKPMEYMGSDMVESAEMDSAATGMYVLDEAKLEEELTEISRYVAELEAELDVLQSGPIADEAAYKRLQERYDSLKSIEDQLAGLKRSIADSYARYKTLYESTYMGGNVDYSKDIPMAESAVKTGVMKWDDLVKEARGLAANY